MADRPPPGMFRMYRSVRPHVPAGSYVLEGDVALPGDVEQLRSHVEVVAPRFTMPPEQVLSTFPPAQSRGAYSTRLPQIVLRRRTLPWERPHGASDARPWVALVLLAEGEGELVPDAPVDQCITPQGPLAGPNDVPKGAYVEVPQSVLDAVFPTQEDLSLLAHVREVDLNDTELALGDDDGWVAVVLANRLPQPGVQYLAVLVSLEGQVGRLPRNADITTEVEFQIGLTHVVDLRVAAHAVYGATVDQDTVTMQLKHTTSGVLRQHGVTAAATRVVRPEAAAFHEADTSWSASAATASPSSAAALGGEGAVVRHAMAAAFAIPAAILLEPTYRFPALAYWSFTCEDSGDFRSLANGLDVGLLGEVRVEDAAPAEPAAELPTDPRQVLVTETGHVGLEHFTRPGGRAVAWFRGPLVPQPVARVEADAEGLPLAHHADQVRIMTPDGREDLSYATAYEIGRLLALSQPSVVAALQRWRQEAYGAARVTRVADRVTAEVPDRVRDALRAADLLAGPEVTAQAAASGLRMARGIVDLLGADPSAVAPARAVVDPGAAGKELRDIVRGDDGLVAGLGLDVPVRGNDPDEVAAGLLSATVRFADEPPADDVASYAVLRTAVEAAAAEVAAGAGRDDRRGPDDGRGPAAAPARRRRQDALDVLIADATRRRTP